jgi:hypothetical protein
MAGPKATCVYAPYVDVSSRPRSPSVWITRCPATLAASAPETMKDQPPGRRGRGIAFGLLPEVMDYLEWARRFE